MVQSKGDISGSSHIPVSFENKVSDLSSPQSSFPVNEAVDEIFKRYKKNTYSEEASSSGYSITARLNRWMRAMGDRLVGFFTGRKQSLQDQVSGVCHQLQETSSKLISLLINSSELLAKSQNLTNAVLDTEETYPKLIELEYLIDAKRQELIDIRDDVHRPQDQKNLAVEALTELDQAFKKLRQLNHQYSPSLEKQLEAAFRVCVHAKDQEVETKWDNDELMKPINCLETEEKQKISGMLVEIQNKTNKLMTYLESLKDKSSASHFKLHPLNNDYAAIAKLLFERQQGCEGAMQLIQEYTNLYINAYKSENEGQEPLQDDRQIKAFKTINLRLDRIWGQSDFFYSVLDRADEALKAEGKVVEIGNEADRVFTNFDTTDNEEEDDVFENFNPFKEPVSWDAPLVSLPAIDSHSQSSKKRMAIIQEKCNIANELANQIINQHKRMQADSFILEHQRLVELWGKYHSAVEDVLTETNSLPPKIADSIKNTVIAARERGEAIMRESTKALERYSTRKGEAETERYQL